MSDIIIEWHGVDCNALKALGTKHKWCIPYDSLPKLPEKIRSEVMSALKDLEIIEDCWEYECIGKDKVKCVGHGKYICAELKREYRPIIMKAIKYLSNNVSR